MTPVDVSLMGRGADPDSDGEPAVFGTEIGDHTRLAVGVAVLPFNVSLEIEGAAGLARAISCVEAVSL